ncbi:hypothetical protein LINGRAHAP2_LOCUS1722 [Linum grandiflorum]
MQRHLDALNLAEEEQETAQFDFPEEPLPVVDFMRSVVGSLLTTRPYNFQTLKHKMEIVWEPDMGMQAEEIGQNLMLFHFFSDLDLRWVIDNGPWQFECYLLVLHELKPGEDPTTVPQHLADFWVQVHNLQPSFFQEQVERGLGEFIGQNSYVTIRIKTPTNPRIRFCASESHSTPPNC